LRNTVHSSASSSISLHAMRNVEERHALGAQPFEHGEDFARRRLGGERGGRLVEDEDARTARQRLGDLDHLPARQRQIPDQHAQG
jgi:hypothetical protein